MIEAIAVIALAQCPGNYDLPARVDVVHVVTTELLNEVNPRQAAAMINDWMPGPPWHSVGMFQIDWHEDNWGTPDDPVVLAQMADPDDGVLDTIPLMREAVGADVVVLWGVWEGPGGASGLCGANMPLPDCTTGYSMASLVWCVEGPQTYIGKMLLPFELARAERFVDQVICPADHDGNGSVGLPDLMLVLANWDGRGVERLLDVLGQWGPCTD